MRDRHTATLVLAFALLVHACTAPPRTETTASGHATVERVTVQGIRAHLEALQRIAEEHGGTRAVGTPGYAASVAYVAETLRAAGYRLELPEADVPAFEQLAPSELELVEPEPRTWVDGVDFRAMLFSGSGDVRSPVTSVEGGCTRADFAGFPPGDVALLEPGPCFRRTQAENARAAGASAVMGISDAVSGKPLRPTLLYPGGLEAPMLSVTAPVGRALAETPGAVVRIHVRAESSYRRARSVIAELPPTDGEPVVMLGGHLDSVIDGPGINDNGSGVAVLLELARWLAGRDPPPAVRFGFWAGEEAGLYGSRDYVEGLSGEELTEIRAYLNLDMVGSPNFVMFVYEGNGLAGSEEISDLFTSFFDREGIPSEPIDLAGASDHAAFAEAGIATGGLHSGALERKTGAQASTYGGTPRRPLDACYHQPCDTFGNLSDEALRQTAEAVAAVLQELLGRPEA
ncbi:MAG TPA: M20/M25/M40 family metallo-hydrolase [Actinomycetota bacterium]|nr:M20/M25/M40 family metallo-hydrolase [Actinomycetota bacterium]